MEVHLQKKLARKRCASEKIIQKLVSHLELDIIVIILDQKRKQDIGHAESGKLFLDNFSQIKVLFLDNI